MKYSLGFIKELRVSNNIGVLKMKNVILVVFLILLVSCGAVVPKFVEEALDHTGS